MPPKRKRYPGPKGINAEDVLSKVRETRSVRATARLFDISRQRVQQIMRERGLRLRQDVEVEPVPSAVKIT